MLLYLVQHGEAKSEEEDPSRGLTDKGFRDVARVALFCREQVVQPVRIHHSGKKRAQQTAQVFSDHLNFMAKLAGLLLCGDKEKMFVDFKMGGILCLKRIDAGRWAVEWMVVPEMVR